MYANALNQSLQIGAASLKKIREKFGSFKNGWNASLERLKSATETKKLEEFRNKINPEKELKTLQKEKIAIFLKDELPQPLQETPFPPEILYIKSNSETPFPNDSHYLAVVGTRKLSAYGKEACEKIVSELKDYNFTIISGLALGIDAIAHKTALKNGMKTIAVLGSGLSNKITYPPANRRLAEEIVEKDGCLISEYPYNMKAAYFTFPQRNRIVAGLSAGTLAIEAPQRSGALITAFMALEYNREVFSLPGSIFSENSKGTNNLLKLGAAAATCGDDILRNFGVEPKTSKNPSILSPTEEKIVSCLFEPADRDELIRKSGLQTREINQTLTQMEIKGIIKESGGQIYLLS